MATNVQPMFRLVANSADVTATIIDRFVSLTLTDESGMESDMLEITLSDHDPFNPLKIPEHGAELELYLGYDGIFQRMGLFVYDEVELGGWPGEMIIRARSAIYAKSKHGKTSLQSQKTRSWPVSTKLGDLVAKIAKEHNMTSAVAASLKMIPLPHIDQSDESDLHLLVRLAKKYDGIVKPADGKIVLAKRGESKSVGGTALKQISIIPADCMSYRMTISKRETAGQVVAYYHAVKEAKRHEVSVGSGEPVRRLKSYYPTQEMALAAARAELQRRQRGQQTVAINIIGSPAVLAEAPLTLAGFRPNIDGEWLITRVTHRLDKSTGYTCDVEAEKPNSNNNADVSDESA